MIMKAFIIYPSYIVEENKTFIQLFGKLENGQSFVSLHEFKPHFFIKTSEVKKVKKYLSKFEVSKTDLTNFDKEPVTKISASLRSDLTKLYRAIHKSAEIYEADLRPHYKFLSDNQIFATMDLEGSYETSEKVDRVYSNPKIKAIQSFDPKLKVASVDIETSSTGQLYCIGIHSQKFHKTFMVTKQKLKSVVPCKSEADCLQKFKTQLLALDPDIITGWNFIDHDLPILQAMFLHNKIPFDIGRSNSIPRIRLESNFFRASSADVSGRIVLDALSFIRDPFIQEAPTIKHSKFESYTLENVSQALLGKGKILKGKDRQIEIDDLYEKNTIASQQKLADYNLLDCKLVTEILEKTKMIPLAIERSNLTGMPINKIGPIASFDSLYIKEAHKRKLVSPTLRFSQKPTPITGGYVQAPTPGLYDNVLVLDFKSLYPSIIRTFNIDPASFLEKPEPGCIQAPNKACFKNTEGILPEIIKKLHEARESAKKQKNELANYTLKILQNSFFGVLASPNCRYFNMDIANAITHFGQFLIKLTAKEIQSKFNLKTIYSDTDSVFVDTELSKQKANALGSKIESHINEFYKSYTKEKHNRQSNLELEFEKQYIKMLIPQLRGQEEKAAKKRYAGLVEKSGKEEIEITGLEAIRGDWTDAAQEFQIELLKKLFHEEKIESFIQEYIKKITQGKLDSKLVYRKSIRKALDEYTKTTPPHVKAARKLPKLDSKIIEYVLTTDGPEPISQIKHKLDYKHYIEKQIKPIANQVLSLFDKDLDEVLQGSKQATLF